MLPIYELIINENLKDEAEVSYVALVDKPAIQRDFIAFADSIKFSVTDEEKRIVSGPLMVADQLIYRNSPNIGEHYVKFSSDTIKQIAIKFFKKGHQQNVNLMHSPDMKVENVTMFESFIVDKERGIAPMAGYEDLPNGSWFGSFYIENEDVWSAVKEGKFKGFSVEGMFDYKNPENDMDKKLQELREILGI